MIWEIPRVLDQNYVFSLWLYEEMDISICSWWIDYCIAMRGNSIYSPSHQIHNGEIAGRSFTNHPHGQAILWCCRQYLLWKLGLGEHKSKACLDNLVRSCLKIEGKRVAGDVAKHLTGSKEALAYSLSSNFPILGHHPTAFSLSGFTYTDIHLHGAVNPSFVSFCCCCSTAIQWVYCLLVIVICI